MRFKLIKSMVAYIFIQQIYATTSIAKKLLPLKLPTASQSSRQGAINQGMLSSNISLASGKRVLPF